MKCFWHPDKDAKYIINLGTLMDVDTPACKRCAAKVLQSKQHGINPNATIRTLTFNEQNSR